jgi:PHP domain
VLPADQHVHTQWSTDALQGSMRDACLRAIELGLPAVTFTDHADLTTLVVSDAAAEYVRAVGGQVDGNDAHDPFTIGHQFAAAVGFAQAAGFGPGRSGRGLWVRN